MRWVEARLGAASLYYYYEARKRAHAEAEVVVDRIFEWCAAAGFFCFFREQAFATEKCLYMSV